MFFVFFSFLAKQKFSENLPTCVSGNFWLLQESSKKSGIFSKIDVQHTFLQKR
jgi:hypothetical protein